MPRPALFRCVARRAYIGFYDRLGHDAVDELVNHFNQIDQAYRSELREVNEQYFARFEARLEQRLAELRAELKAEMAVRFAAMDAGFERLRTEIVAARADTIKWMFFFIATAVLAILGLG